MKATSILFIHGMFMNHSCFDQWKLYYESKGYKCLVPDWPYHNKSVRELNSIHPNEKLGKLNLQRVLDHYESIINSLDEKPVLIGHSMGGLIVQMLLNKDMGSAGIVIDSAAPVGVVTLKWSFMKSNLPIINPLKGDEPCLLTFKQFQYAFTNGMSLKEQQAAFETFAVPESRNVGRSSLKMGKIDFARSRNPLLFIAGKEDHIIPASLNKTNFDKYKASPSVTNFKEFTGRNHFIIGQSNWKEVADYALEWILKQ